MKPITATVPPTIRSASQGCEPVFDQAIDHGTQQDDHAGKGHEGAGRHRDQCRDRTLDIALDLGPRQQHLLMDQLGGVAGEIAQQLTYGPVVMHGSASAGAPPVIRADAGIVATDGRSRRADAAGIRTSVGGRRTSCQLSGVDGIGAAGR